VSEKSTQKVSEKILAILAVNGAATIAELAATLSISTRTVERNLQKLSTTGRLQRVGSARAGRWQVTHG
jgi:ATP-dependent DNA helicase RecG